MNLLLNSYLKYIFVFWPVVVAIIAWVYRRKQNGLNPWTGGRISWPKSFWLSYTIHTWFFLPFFFFLFPETPVFLKMIIGFHLLSWWVRGILELVMIYKWLNWSPRYGIGHDLFHITVLILFFTYFKQEFSELAIGSQGFLVGLYAKMLLVTTAAEVGFAVLFLKLRTIQESGENVYFASDDPKWIFVNRVTLVVVCIAFLHLIYQSVYALKYF